MTTTRTRVRALVLALLVAGAAVAGPAGVAAQGDGPPSPPAAYYGDLTLDGDPAPAGVEVTAYIDGEERGSYLTAEAGSYGSSSALEESLTVRGEPGDEGALVEFTVNGQPVDATVEWESGTVENVDLAASASGDPPGDGGGAPGDGGDAPGDGGDAGDAPGGGDGADGADGADGSTDGAQAAGPAPSPAGSAAPTVDATVDSGDSGEWAVSVSADSVDADATVDADLGDAFATDAASVEGVSVTVAQDVDAFGLSIRQLDDDEAAERVGELDGATSVSYLEFEPDGFESSSVAETEFSFTVNESALPEGTSPKHVSLYRFDDGWNAVPTAYNGDGEYVATAEGFSVFAIGAADSGVGVATASLESDAIAPGELAVVSATIENTGDAEGTAAVTLRVDGETVDDRQVTLGPDESREVTFTPRFDEPGDYSVAVGDETAGDLSVESVESSAAEDDESGSDTAAATGSDGGVAEAFGVTPLAIAGVLALALVVVGTIALRRR